MNQNILDKIAASIRILTVDAIEKANSGHPGLPLGLAELGGLIFAEILNHNPKDPEWVNRDRFVLSAGHGSMLLYSLLHLTGYDVSLEDLKRFRTVHSKTPGHPEYGDTPGVETTTGPLGQGFGNAVGMAIAERMMEARFNTSEIKIIDHRIYVIAGDGDLMEGISYEAASLAGHLGLGNLIVFYDDNKLTIDGETGLAFSEDVLRRFEAFHWQTFDCDAYDYEAVMTCVARAKEERNRPALIKVRSEMGRGSPTYAGTHRIHSGALGAEEITKMKLAMGVDPDEQFYIFPEIKSYIREKADKWEETWNEWQKLFGTWKKNNPSLAAEWQNTFVNESRNLSLNSENLPSYKAGEMVATRTAGGIILNTLFDKFPGIIGGTADLTAPCLQGLTYNNAFTPANPQGRLLYYGIREHAMGAVSNGLALYGFRPFCSTFLSFSDYLRPAIRLSALMKLPVIYIFPYDSVWNGEDGPTHQPVEHLAALRAIPRLLVLRPGDAEEVEVAWILALTHFDGPSAISLTRQNLPVYEKYDRNWRETAGKGAYVVKESEDEPVIVIVATGSEVSSALTACEGIPSGKGIRIVSMISRELFLRQDSDFRESIIPQNCKLIIVEAGIAQGWEILYTNRELNILSVEDFGYSGPGELVAEQVNIGPNAIRKRIITELNNASSSSYNAWS